MAVSTDITVVGIKDAIKAIGQLDKAARRKITTDYKQIVSSVVSDAQSKIPTSAPLSGMNYNWTTKSGFQMFPWGLSKDVVKAAISTRKPKEFGETMTNLATFFVRFSGPHSTLFDMSGKGPVPTPQGSRMVQGLNRYGTPSRLLWPAYERNADNVQARMRELIDQIMRDAQSSL